MGFEMTTKSNPNVTVPVLLAQLHSFYNPGTAIPVLTYKMLIFFFVLFAIYGTNLWEFRAYI